ncbi:MAG TPA: choice-of-anchor D domain-containing protein [Acidisarcina sp.]
MGTSRFARVIAVSAVIVAGAFSSAYRANAQEITYYDFDTPQTNNSFSYHCLPAAPGSPATTPAIFCFNDATGKAANPSFLTDLYPASIDPVTTDMPPVASNHVAIQTSPATPNQGSSVWFSVPQKVAEGFTSYFAFKLTPNAGSYATADGIAFVIQNASGGAGAPPDATCIEKGSGPSVVGGAGGCIGYGGIDNSLAVEFDTYRNAWDPTDTLPVRGATFNDNHVAIQNCGAGLPNSPSHTGACLVSLTNGQTLQAAINGALPVTLADGNVHQIVVSYSGPTEATPNLLQVFIDPPFVPGTHTPAIGAVPALSGTYNLAGNLNLMNSGSSVDSAYVGFTSATGSAFEQSELMAWTFTPHSTVQETQPIAPPGQPTVFPFGAHTFAATFPPGVNTSGIDLTVTANTITPVLFAQIIAGTPFAGSQCQLYDETGGNCVVYSASCTTHGTTTIVPCPPATDPNNLIALKSALNNSIQPITPGFLQGDPAYSLLSSVTGNGQVATVTCIGECVVTAGQTVTIGGTTMSGNGPGSFNGAFTVLAADPNVPNMFTFTSSTGGSATGGFVTSSNLKNVFTSYIPQRIDGTFSGKTKNFSDFVTLAVTSSPVSTATSLTIQAPQSALGYPAPVTVTAGSSSGVVPGSISLAVDGGTPQVQPLVNGVASFSLSSLSPGTHTLVASYAGQSSFASATANGTITVVAKYLVFSPQSANFANVGTGTTAGPIFVTVTNATKQPASYVTSANLNNFSIMGGTCGPITPATVIAPGASCTFSVTFSPTVMGLQVGSFTLATPSQSVLFQLKGNGVYPRLVFTPPVVNFGNVATGTTSNVATITIANFTGGQAVLQGTSNFSEFNLVPGTCATLAAGGTCSFQVSFSPTTPGQVKGVIAVNSPTGLYYFTAYGTGVTTGQ